MIGKEGERQSKESTCHDDDDDGWQKVRDSQRNQHALIMMIGTEGERQSKESTYPDDDDDASDHRKELW